MPNKYGHDRQLPRSTYFSKRSSQISNKSKQKQRLLSFFLFGKKNPKIVFTKLKMIEQLKSMYENSLWSSLVHIAPYALSLYGSESDLDPKSDKSGRKRHQVLVMIADAYFETKEFKKAENLYKEAIQLRKQFKVVKKSELGAVDQSADEFQTEGKLALNSTDVEVKFKLHLCYIYTNQVI